MSVVTAPFRWLRDHPYAISVLILSGAVALSFWIDAQQDARERREEMAEVAAQQLRESEARVDLAEHDARIECRTGNDSRAQIRTIGVDLALANANALIGAIQATGEPADPAAVEDFLIRTRNNATAIVSTLGERDCDQEAAEARRVAAEVEGIEP